MASAYWDLQNIASKFCMTISYIRIDNIQRVEAKLYVLPAQSLSHARLLYADSNTNKCVYTHNEVQQRKKIS